VNRVLFGVSIAAVVLLGPSFILGYVFGYRTARANGPPDASTTALGSSQMSALPSSPIAPKKFNRTAQTILAGRVDSKESAPAGQADQPAAGQIYLQLVTTAKSRSGAIMDALRNNGFPVATSDVPGKADLQRVLIGPLHEGEVDKIRAALQSKRFPSHAAFERTF